MLNKIILLTVCSLFIVGCKCGDDGASSNVSRVPIVYDVQCYEGGVLIVDITTPTTPTVRVDNTYWRDDDTNELIDIAASCVVNPRRSNEPKTSLVSSPENIINEE